MRLSTSVAIAIFFACSAVADVNRGAELYRQGKFTEAEAELRRAVEKEPSNGRAHRFLGLALIEQEKLDEAARQLAKAAEIEPGGESKLALARLYIAQKSLEKAEAELGEASGDDLEYVRGLLKFHRKEYEAAVKDFEASLQKNPENAYAHYYAGMAYNSMKRPDKMLTHFDLFLRARPDAPEARKVRAVLKTVQ